MSTTSITHDPDPKTTSSTEFVHTLESLQYVITHVCLPDERPDESDYTLEKDLWLVRAVCAAAHAYASHVSGTIYGLYWDHITRMLDNLQASLQSENLDRDHVISQLRGMETRDVLAFLVRSQNSAIILTKREDCMLIESFELFPSTDVPHETAEAVVRSYPECTVEMPSELMDSEDLQFKLADFLSGPETLNSDFPHPLAYAQHAMTLFSSILRGASRTVTVDVPHISKRIRDGVRGSRDRPASSLWRRSAVWLLIRVTIQVYLDRFPVERILASYKKFMFFFLCTIAKDPTILILPSDIFNPFASKISGRVHKLKWSLSPPWLRPLALTTCHGLQGMLGIRKMQTRWRPSPSWNLPQDQLRVEAQVLLEQGREHVRNTLANYPYSHSPTKTTFHPSHRRRGTIVSFLPSDDGPFLEKALAPRCKTRVLVNPPAEPLYSFRSQKEFLNGLITALEFHKELTEKGILHQDIHPDSIVYKPSEQGDRSVLLTDVGHVRRFDRSATLFVPYPNKMSIVPFVSLSILREAVAKRKEDGVWGDKVGVEDDLESFFYVFIWICVLYTGPNGMVRTPAERDGLIVREWGEATDCLTLVHDAKSSFVHAPNDIIEKQFTPYFQNMKMLAKEWRLLVEREDRRREIWKTPVRGNTTVRFYCLSLTHDKIIGLIRRHAENLSSVDPPPSTHSL